MPPMKLWRSQNILWEPILSSRYVGPSSLAASNFTG